MMLLPLRWRSALGSACGVKLTYIGDGNTVGHSLIVAGARVGAHVRIATPAGYEPDAEIVATARSDAAATQGTIELFRSPEEAVAGAQAVYTDVWASMGQESETQARAAIFAPYQVNAALMSQAAPDAVFLHCLPAHRGSEVTDEVMESPRSIVFDQAENRLHVQKAILANATKPGKDDRKPKKVVLAYSGGLDTSIIIPLAEGNVRSAKLLTPWSVYPSASRKI